MPVPVLDALPVRRTPTLDVALLRKAIEYIQDHPEDWEQATWGARFDVGTEAEHPHGISKCATPCCVAGTVCLLSGGEFTTVWSSEVRMPGGPTGHAGDIAQLLLGLTNAQASTLFDTYNDLTELQEIAASFIAEAEATG